MSSQIRIIGGEFGGRRINTPTRDSTHAMGDRIRTAIFNMVDCENKNVLDAFAGSGSLGITAVSHGAKCATFIEKDRKAANVIVKNTTDLGISKKCKVIATTVHNWATTTVVEPETFDLIFVDPPYHDTQFSTLNELVNYLKLNGLMVLSLPGRLCDVPSIKGAVVVDSRNYGEATIAYFRKEK